METTQKSSKGFKFAVVILLFLTILLAAAIAAVALNPSEEAHHNAVSSNVSKAVNELFFEQTERLVGEEYPAIQKVAKQLGEPLIKETVTDIVDTQLEYHDYIVFSTTTYTIPATVTKLLDIEKEEASDGSDDSDGTTKTISVGAFGKVFTASKDDIKHIIGLKVASVIDKSGFITKVLDDDRGIVGSFQSLLFDEDTEDKVRAGLKFINELIELLAD